MDLQEIQQLLDSVQIGYAMLDKTVSPRLEAFFGNAIYYRRGMPTMNKYKTVKEVCDLTGLNTKAPILLSSRRGCSGRSLCKLLGGRA